MKTNRIIPAGLAGGVTFFLLGYLVYGVLLSSYMARNLNQCAAKPMVEMVWWAMILANLALGFILAFVCSWSYISGMRYGAKIGAILGVLISVSTDLGTYSLSNMYNSFSVILVDVAAYTVMLTITGIVVGKVLELKQG